MIVLDTTILVYFFLGGEHPFREASRRLFEAVRGRQVEATTTVEVVQELVHVRGRRRPRAEAVRLGRALARALAPLLRPTSDDLGRGLSLFEAHPALGAFEAVLAAAAVARGAEALVSADRAFAGIPGLVHLAPDAPELAALLGS